MALIVLSREAESLARELAEMTGETATEAVTNALAARIQQLKKRKQRTIPTGELDQIITGHSSGLPTWDCRSAEDMLRPPRINIVPGLGRQKL